MVALDRIAELHGLKATPQEVVERVSQIAERGRVDPEEVRAQLSKAKRLEGLARSITETNVFDFLKKQSEILDET
jgi:FKBP-type peptidyl-prolyl cis-trans isomerase (trigger factor)